jgi:hypothetical protein
MTIRTTIATTTTTTFSYLFKLYYYYDYYCPILIDKAYKVFATTSELMVIW